MADKQLKTIIRSIRAYARDAKPVAPVNVPVILVARIELEAWAAALEKLR